jgi:hypothetical protein
MENTQVEIQVLEAAVLKALEKDLREFQELQLALVGGGCAEVCLA